jgi:hypothetical protein
MAVSNQQQDSGNNANASQGQRSLLEAEMLELQVVEARNRVLGEEHPDSLTSVANLASIYVDQDRLKEAEVLEVQVMEKKLGVIW